MTKSQNVQDYTTSCGTISFCKKGTGPALLLLHGLGSSSEDWQFQEPELSSDFTLIIPDLPGHGASSKLSTTLSLKQIAITLDELMHFLHYDTYYVMGFSFGSFIALELIEMFPDKVTKLILVSSALKIPYSIKRTVRSLIFHLCSWKQYAKILAFILFPNKKHKELYERTWRRLSMCDKESYKRNFQALLLYDAREYAPKIGAKTLIVIGKEDPIINLQLGIALHQKITDSKLEIFEQVGHVVFAEEPEKFNTIVRNFLQESQ